MSETEPSRLEQDPRFAYSWMPSPTFVVDGVIGVALANSLARLSLGQITVNHQPGAAIPMLTPACHIAVTEQAVENLITALTDIRESMREQNA